MGKCNLLAPVDQTTGNFILFSQYAEDLTRSSQSEDFYRVTPSKYVLLNLNTSGLDPVKFSEYFQNYYENACSVVRKYGNWNPEYASALFWKTLFKSKTGYTSLATVPSQGDGIDYVSPSVIRVGDINITSTRQFDGINYSEIYINVPQGAKREKYRFTKYSSDMTRIFQYPNNYIMGYPDDEYPTPGTEGGEPKPWPSNRLDSRYCEGTVIVEGETQFIYEIFENSDFCLDTEAIGTMDDASYTFNAVAVLYDVHKKNPDTSEDTTIYKDIPMGLYLTGAPNVQGTIQNPVTIWVENSDIYEQGTSYGFRICTRYLSTQNALRIVDSTIESTNDMYDQYAAVMGKIGDSMTIMDGIVASMGEYQENINSHLANIKNYKVNVPYIREIGGKYYWFVNGKNMGVAAHQTSLVWENY